MKYSMVKCISTLCKDINSIETMMCNKYDKFIIFYWLIHDYDDNICKLSMEESEDDSLDIYITMDKKETAKEFIKQCKKAKKDNCELCRYGKTIYLSIYLHESNEQDH